MSGQPYVVAIGGANVDLHARADSAIDLHDSNPGTVHECAGGVARNIAENLARLGVACRLVSAIGNDARGDRLIRDCVAAGIDTQHVLRVDDRRTSTYVSVVDANGELHVAINDMAIMDALGPDNLQCLTAMLQQAGLIVIDANLSPATLAWFADELTDTVLFADTVSASKASGLEPVLHRIHTLKLSRGEARALTGMDTGTQEQLEIIGLHLHDKGVERVFITLGEDGVFYFVNGESGVAQAAQGRDSVANVGGAGDAFLAALACAWLREWSLQQSLEFGLSVAGMALDSASTSNPELSFESAVRAQEMRDGRG